MSKPWFVYLLLCDQKTFYVGITTNIAGRVNQHRAKESFFTKKFFDVELVCCERYKLEHEAAMREKQIKGWSRAKKQMLIDRKLGFNYCTDFAKALLADKSHVSLHRAKPR